MPTYAGGKILNMKKKISAEKFWPYIYLKWKTNRKLQKWMC